MKKSMLLGVLIQVASAVQANHLDSDLHLEMANHGWFSVAVDHHYYAQPDRSYDIRGLGPGAHFVEVFAHGSHPYGPGPGQGLVFGGYVDVPAASVVFGRVEGWNGFRVMQVLPKYAAPAACAPVPAPAPVVCGMDPYRFDELVRTIRHASFDNSRLAIARQALDRSWVSSAQVRTLMELMTFESTRLKLAKSAYGHVVDKERFYIVNDAFTFSSSVHDLDGYIRQYS